MLFEVSSYFAANLIGPINDMNKCLEASLGVSFTHQLFDLSIEVKSTHWQARVTCGHVDISGLNMMRLTEYNSFGVLLVPPW